MTTQKNYEMDMTEGNLLPKIIRFSLPVVLTGILQFFYNAADMIVAGKFAGATALAAVGSTGSLINLIVALFMGISVGVSVVVAQHYGAKETDEVQKTVHSAMLVSIVGGVLIGIFGFFMSRIFLSWMSCPADVLDQAALYTKIYFLGLPALMIYNFGASILRAVGDTKRPMYFLIVSGALNCALNLVFVISFKMGVAGVAWATIISETLSAVLVVYCLMHTPGAVRFYPSKMCINWEKLRAMMRIGLPAGLQSSLFSISGVLIQSSINTFGSLAVAGNGAAGNLENFIYITMNCVSQSALSFVSQNVGAKKYERIGTSVKYCNILVFIVAAVTGVVIILFRGPLLSLYNSDPEVIAYGSVRLLVIGTPYCLCGFMEVFTGTLRGMGKSVMPMIVTIFGACVLRIVWLETVCEVWHTMAVIYLSYPVTWAITALIEMVCYYRVKNKLIASGGAELVRQ